VYMGSGCTDVKEAVVIVFLLNYAFSGGGMREIMIVFSYVRVSEKLSFVSDGDGFVS